jgi:hypothetical protein
MQVTAVEISSRAVDDAIGGGAKGVDPARGWSGAPTLGWLLLSLAWFVAAFFVSVGVAVLTLGHVGNLGYAAMATSWSLVGYVGFVGLAWAGRVLRIVGQWQAILSIVTTSTASVFAASYVAWALARYGTLDPDVLAESVLIPILGTGVGLYSAISVITNRPVSVLATAIASLSMVVMTLVGLRNISGLADGISAEGIWMMVTAAALAATWLLCTMTVARDTGPVRSASTPSGRSDR